MMDILSTIPTPAYVADIAALKRNMAIARRLKDETKCTLLLATKSCAMTALFPLMASVLDGTTASGYYEARLGHEHFGAQVHTYSPAYSDTEIEQLLPICKHIYFNSAAQLERYAPRFRTYWGDEAVIGLRVNPQFSQVSNASIYDPSASGSRFGVYLHEIDDALLAQIDLLHVHNLCENMASDSAALIDYLMQNAPHLLEGVAHVNVGGGHYVTHPEYDLALLIDKINMLQNRFDVRVTLEPGGAWAYNAGYLVSTVLDIIERSPFQESQNSHESAQTCNAEKIAILDTSATCHMPDVLEMPYRPAVIGDCNDGAYRYQLTGRTCLTGDIIGSYAFDKPLAPAERIIFTDMLQYSMVKNTTFNGVPLPDIGILHEDGSYESIKQFDYEDFAKRLG